MSKKKRNEVNDLYDMSVQEELLRTLKEFNDYDDDTEIDNAEKIIKKVTEKQQISGKELKFDGSEEPALAPEFKEIDEEYDNYFSFLKKLRHLNLIGIILTVFYSAFFIFLIISLGVNNFSFNREENEPAYSSSIFFCVALIVVYLSLLVLFLQSLHNFDFSKFSTLENKLMIRLSIILVIILGFIPFVNMIIAIFPRVFLKPYSEYRDNEYNNLNLWYQESIASLFDEDDVEKLFNNNDNTIVANPQEVFNPTNPIPFSRRISLYNHGPYNYQNEYWRNRPIFNVNWVHQNNLMPSIILTNMQKIIEALRKENREMQEFIKKNLFRRYPPPALPSKPKRPSTASKPRAPESSDPLIIENKQGKIKFRLVDDNTNQSKE